MLREMKKTLVAPLAATFLLLLPAYAHAQVSMTLFSDTPATHPKSVLLQALATRIDERTDGRIAAEFFSVESDLFDSEDAALDALADNDVQMVWPPVARLERFAPEFKLLTLPYSIELFTIRDSEGHSVLVDGLSSQLEDTGLQLVGLAPAGYTLFVSKNPLTNVEQLDGKTIRVPGSPMLMDYLAELGATGVNYPAPQLSEILGNGSVDVILTSFAGWKLVGPADGAYVLVDLDMRIGFYGATLNRDWFEALDAADRQIVLEETSKTIAARWHQLEDEKEAFKDEMRAEGTVYTEISGEEAMGLVSAADAIRDKYIAPSPEFFRNYLK